MKQEEFDDFVNKIDNMEEGYNSHNFYIGDFLSLDHLLTYRRFVLKPLNIIIIKNEDNNSYTIDWINNNEPVIIAAEEFQCRLETIKHNMENVFKNGRKRFKIENLDLEG